MTRRHAWFLVFIVATVTVILILATQSVTLRDSPIPKIAWEGGPAYWEQWPSTKPWINPSFFPIGV